MVKGEGGVYKGQKSHNPVVNPIIDELHYEHTKMHHIKNGKKIPTKTIPTRESLL